MSAGLRTLRLRNFRRYDDETVSLVDGLNFLEGPNNAGKTSILYAIEYALYGRVGSLSAAGLMRPKERTVGVELTFVDAEGTTWCLQRIGVRPPKSRTTVNNHFTLKARNADEESERYVLASDFDDKETDLARKLVQIFGFTRRAWELAVHHKQGSITDILDGSRKLDFVLGVSAAGFVEEELRAMALAREKAAAELPTLEARVEQLGADHTRLTERLTGLHVSVEEADGKVQAASTLRDTLEQERAALEAADTTADAYEAAAARLVQAEQALTVAEEALAALPTDDALATAVKDAAATAVTAEAAWTTSKSNLEQCHAAERENAAVLGDLEGRLGRLQGLDGEGACSHCGQSLTPEHLAQERGPLQTSLAEHREESVQRVRARETATQSTEAAADSFRQAETSVETAREAVASQAGAAAVVEAARTAVAQANEELADASSSAGAMFEGVSAEGLRAHLVQQNEAGIAARARVEADEQHAREMLERLNAERQEVQDQLNAADRDLASTRTAADGLRADAAVALRLRALGKGFKTVQTELRDHAANAMADRALEMHRHLSGDDKEIKALSINPKNYAVNVTPHDIGTKVPASLYQGGGHRLLLGLSVKLALAEHIGPVPFVLLDEPTYGLDAARKALLLERISGLDVAGQLVLITHANLEDGSAHRQIVHREGKLSHIRGGS